MSQYSIFDVCVEPTYTREPNSNRCAGKKAGEILTSALSEERTFP